MPFQIIMNILTIVFFFFMTLNMMTITLLLYRLLLTNH